MRNSRSLFAGLCGALGMLVLILDSKTAINGAAQGIRLCIQSVIPALFPFFVLSAMLTGTLTGIKSPILRPLGKLCGIPKGGESILLSGLLGGYPVGAQCISQAYTNGKLSQSDARRMLGFCSNAGPSFLFGMSGILFNTKSIPFILWMIHIISALIVGMILPKSSSGAVIPSAGKQVHAGQAVQTAVRSIATVCSWVILFRMILCFADRWFLWLLPEVIQILITGILELTNGYLELAHVQNEGLRFVLASIFLSFGGFCVILQTASITGQAGLDLGSYFLGKLLQTAVSAALSVIVSGLLFPGFPRLQHPWIVLLTGCIIIVAIITKIKQNSSSILTSSGV